MKCIYILLVLLHGLILAACEVPESNKYLEALRQRPWKSVHKYIEVRPGAFLFYWLYYADSTRAGADQKPLIIWIQGGPGNAASGIGNFCELGPLKTDMSPRNYTWVNGRNILLIDHPVGAGFSYAVNTSLYVTSDREAVKDLLRFTKAFFKIHKEFRKTPTYVVGQSYGGKLTARLGYFLHTAIERKRIKMNFKGIGIGGGWIDTSETSKQQPRFLFDMGLIDIKAFRTATKIAENISSLIKTRNYSKAGQLDYVMFDTIMDDASYGYDMINLENVNHYSYRLLLKKLDENMNMFVKPTLNVNQSINWQHLTYDVYFSLQNSFVEPGTKFLEILLNRTNLKVVVYNGNLDAVTPLCGATNWVHNLKWHGAKHFFDAKRVPIRGERSGFYKTYGKLSFWAVFGSGHWVPEDNPTAMEQILQFLTQNDS
ncbi:retinoid-inducible serine carboxypeptidase-like isoform X1 [Pieris napi]|uniref:retinoid-inducible serine carboxypeptidase-like isoform X1 n=1 Tax=Pieris napi TaxID=78633 RepID=UPI001FBA4E0C|nr:retinoid-inducible serine carboxypeptidase-like isoform X1 [Pieris napi]